MNILLDENIDVRFKALFPVDKYEIYTVRDMQWNGSFSGTTGKNRGYAGVKSASGELASGFRNMLFGVKTISGFRHGRIACLRSI